MTTPTAETYEQRIDREKRERKEQTETGARTIAAAMTAATGEEWNGIPDPETYDPHFTLKRFRDGVTVQASYSQYRNPGKWHVYAGHVTTADGKRLWLNEHKRRDEETSANISGTKPPAQIARDIIRRVLPITEELAQRALAAHALELDRKGWLERTAAEFMEATKERLALRPSHHDEKSTRRELRHWSKPYVTVTLDAYDHEVKVEVDDIPPEAALAMLAQLPAVAPEPEEQEAEV